MRLYLIPYAGGSAASFRSWPAVFSPFAEAVPLDIPGHGRSYIDAAEDLTINEMARKLAARLADEQRPYGLFGHSMGALLAFEASRMLCDGGRYRPSVLLASSHRAPHLPLEHPPLHGLNDADFDKELEKLAGTPGEILSSTEMMDLIRPTLRRDLTAAETHYHEFEGPLPIPLASFGGEGDSRVSANAVSDWASHSTRFLGSYLFPGGHFYFQGTDGGLEGLASAVRRILKMV